MISMSSNIALLSLLAFQNGGQLLSRVDFSRPPRRPTPSRGHFEIILLYIYSTNCIMALGSTHPLTDRSTRILPGGKQWPARNADNLTPSVSRFSRKYGIQDVSQTYNLPCPVTGIALPFFIIYIS
jgi:hypothetical protein